MNNTMFKLKKRDFFLTTLRATLKNELMYNLGRNPPLTIIKQQPSAIITDN